jgi:1-acyl-sn-glycerol-3-phosphate acyltransferase
MWVIVRLAFKAYFRKIYLIDRDKIPKKGALVMTPNHPSAFMEACLLACFQPRSLYFLVRGDIFSNPRFLPFLRGTHQVPIFRAQDGFSNLRKNDETFRFCYLTLSLKRTVVIFPESKTIWEKRLRPIQKGAAKLSFGAMRNHPDLDLKIVPVGVNFEDPRKFQSDVMIRFGDPIDLNSYLDQYEAHPQQTIRNVSNELGTRMEKLVYILGDKEKENAFDIAEEMFRNSFYRVQSTIFEYQYMRFSEEKRLSSFFNSSDSNSFRVKVEGYQDLLEVKKIKDIQVCQSGFPFWKNVLSVIFSTPLWVGGLVLTSFPAFISYKITTSRVKDQAFVGPIKMSLGIFLYGVYFLLATILFISLCGWNGLFLTIILMSLAYFVARTHLHHLNTWKSIYFMVTNRASMNELRLKRTSIMDQMHKIVFDENSISNAK